MIGLGAGYATDQLATQAFDTEGKLKNALMITRNELIDQWLVS